MRVSKAGIFSFFSPVPTAGVSLLLTAALLPALFCPGCAVDKPEPAAQTSYSARVETDPASGLAVVVLTREGAHPLEARIAPEAGANLFSLVYQGTELLYTPPSLADFDGSRLGTPVLYPSPCRLARGRFSFDGEDFDFGTNRGDTWIHGLVRSEPWQYEAPAANEGGASLLTWIDISPGSPLYEKFNFDHRLSLLFTLDEKGIRLAYEVKNRDSRRLPYGFGLHTYFDYVGGRDAAYVCVPADEQMGLANLVPTGSLEKLEGSPFDLRQPRAVGNLALDNVYFGMTPQRPAFIEFRKAGVKISLTASGEFTHLIVWNNLDNPFFCVENMTCSPDVYNVYSKGFAGESHLMIVPPQGVSRGWVHFIIGALE